MEDTQLGSGRYQAARNNLTLLQDLVRKDPQAYKQEFLAQYAHFNQTLKLFELQSDGLETDHLIELVNFVAHVSPCYAKQTTTFAEDLSGLLRKQGANLPPDVRLSLVKAVVLLRNRNRADPQSVQQLLFELLACRDKNLRKFIVTSTVSYIKLINTKTGHRNPKVNTALSNYILSRLRDSQNIIVRAALRILIEGYKKKFWQDAKTANAIADCCFHKVAKIKTTALNFLLGTDNSDGDIDQDEEETNEEKEAPSKSLKEIMVGFRVAKKTRKGHKQLKKAQKGLDKKEKEKKNPAYQNQLNLSALHNLYDPQAFGERLFKSLEGGGKNERFELKMIIMGLVARIIGVHQLIILSFYPFLNRYLQPHQRDVTKILLYAAQACHEIVPPDTIEALIRVIANNFVTDRNSVEVIVVGLNSIREILAKCTFAITEDLLHDLAAYKRYRNKNVAVAARSIIALYREQNPHLLRKRDRGKPTEASNELVVKSYASNPVREFILGAECLNVEDEGNDSEDWQEDEDSEEEDNGWINVEHEDTPALGDKEMVEDLEDEATKETRAQLVSSTRILSQDEHRKIQAHQVRKRILPYRKNKNNEQQDEKKRRRMEEQAMIAEPNSAFEAGRLPSLKDIEKLHKNPKQNKESRLESVIEGREGREKYNKPKDKGPHVGRTQKQLNKSKPFVMLLHKNKKKNKRSFQVKQRSLMHYLTKQKKMK